MNRVHSNLFLRRVLLANASFSTFSAAVLIAGGAWLAPLLGIAFGILAGVGIGLLVFAAGLWRAARAREFDRGEARKALAADVAWVVASVVLLVWNPSPLTAAGWWGVAVVADLVAVFAALQLYGLYRDGRRRAEA